MAFSLAMNCVERTRLLTIECPAGGSYTVKALRERIVIDGNGKPVRDEAGNNVVIATHEITRVIDSNDPDAIRLASAVSAKVDVWAQDEKDNW